MQTDFPYRGSPALHWLGWFHTNVQTSPTLGDRERSVAHVMLNALEADLNSATTDQTTRKQHALCVALGAYLEALGEVEF
jgi:hypothetical protein